MEDLLDSAIDAEREVEEERGEEASHDHRLTGNSEEEFESLLLYGCLGFSLSFGCAAVMMIEAAFTTIDPMLFAGSILISAIAAVIELCIGASQTDRLQNAGGGARVFVIVHTVSFIAAIAFMWAGIHPASELFASVGLISTLFLYGQFLVALARRVLMLIVDVAFMCVGVLLLIIPQLNELFTGIIITVVALVAVVVSALLPRKTYGSTEFVSAADSKARGVKVKGNNHTLAILGFMTAITALSFTIDLPTPVVVTVMGCSVGLAGIVSLLLRQFDERVYKESLKKSLAFVSCLFLLPLAVVPPEVQLLLLAAFSCVVSLNAIVLINAVVETSGFNMISPLWLFGQEGAVYFAGAACGAALLLGLGAAMSYGLIDAGMSLWLACVVAAIVCAWMQISVNYQIYPFEPVIEEEPDEEAEALLLLEGKRRSLWHKRIDAACERYRLSPREREVLGVLLKGRDAKYIMDTFCISMSTAKTHIYNIYRKFGIHSRQELLDFIDEIEVSLDDD